MLDVVGWSRRFNLWSSPWLIVGKGPTFRKVRDIDLSGYHVCSLNHVVRELPVTLAHIIDIDVVADCAREIYQNAKFLAMPYRPHFKNYPSSKTLADFIAEIQVLEAMEREGRLVWYNLSSSPPHLDSPVINAVYFSSEAALNLLVTAGAREVRTLGVDGGQTYSEAFDDLQSRTLLANGQESFDKQFGGICETIRKSGVLYAPLYIEAPIRIFVGADAAQSLGVKMLEYSVKRRTPVSVALERIDDTNIPVPREPQNKSRSGFSFSRFDIPRRCGYRGKAIYMDADMQVFTDVTRLWNWEMNGAAVLYCDGQTEQGRPPQYSVMLMDCSRLAWDAATIVRELDAGKYTYEELMQDLCILPESQKKKVLPFEWNSLEHYEEGRTCLIHYTDMNTQPWVSNNNPNGYLWYRLLKEALVEGFITGKDLRAEIDQGHVSPQLPQWAELPDIGGVANAGKDWIPPYKRFLKDDSKVANVQIPGEPIPADRAGCCASGGYCLSVNEIVAAGRRILRLGAGGKIVEEHLDPTSVQYPFPFRRVEVSEAAVTEVNHMLNWHAGTILNLKGQMLLGRLGTTPDKRTKPGPIPDRRITELHNRIDLRGKSILEVGCFEGIHTLGLRLYSDDVTAIDIRPSNVIKTLARLSLHGTYAKVFIADVERLSPNFGQFDVIFHCGVLYHLASPVEHLFSLKGMCNHLMLDTHVTAEQDEERATGDFTYRGKYHEEAGWSDPFSGKDSRSFWLTEEGLQEALRRAGFSSIVLVERRAERNGPRVVILASR